MNDVIFLLSEEEYNKYFKKITPINQWWWFRDKSKTSDKRACGMSPISRMFFEEKIQAKYLVRPALNTSLVDNKDKLFFYNDNLLFYCGNLWERLDDDLFLSIIPIGSSCFDPKSNEYETSEIRREILKWLEERKDFISYTK